MTRNPPQADMGPPLDPEVAALVRACQAADQERRAGERGVRGSLDWGLDGKPTEFKLALGPTAMMCIGAGVLSAIGGLVVFGWAEADAFDLLVSQLPAAGLITLAFARSQGKKLK